jgi:transposase
MRGEPSKQSTMLTLRTPDQRVPKDHPIRRIKQLADEALNAIATDLGAMYSATGRPSIPPERLLKASLLMALYTVRSERLFCEQLDYNLLFRWFLDMDAVENSFDHSSFSRNRERLLKHRAAEKFFVAVVEQARASSLLSSEHFSVDGTLIDAWASVKSFRPKDETPSDRDPPDDKGNPSVSFHGEKRTNDTHESKTDPEAKLMRKGSGKEARLSFASHALMENRNGLLIDLRLTQASGVAERNTALEMLDAALPGTGRITLGADAGFTTQNFLDECRARNVTPHVALKRKAASPLDGRTTRHKSYALSQRARKRIEEIFGWMKTVGNFRRTRYRGVARSQLAALLVGTAYNLLRMSKLLTPRTA